MTALDVALPVYIPDGFATYREPDHDGVVAWLVPIGTAEADVVAHHGWSAFEDLLVERDPDLVDWHRPELVDPDPR